MALKMHGDKTPQKLSRLKNLHMKKSHMNLKKYNIPAPIAGICIFIGAFFITMFASSSFIPVQPSNAEDVAAVLNSSGYFINLTSGNGGVVAIDVLGTAAGTVGLARDTINIKSNAPDGYDLYLGMDNKNVDGNRLYKDGDSTSSSFITPTSGTFSAPAVLDTNSWGYALANTTPGLPTEGANFDAQYNPSIPDDASLWASVPLAGNEQLIQTITTPNPTDGINTDIYYGAKANVSLPSGSYKGTITYTAIAKTNSSVNEYTSVSPATTTKLEGGEILTIATMLGVDAADAEDPGTPAKRVTVTVGGQACPLTTGIVGDPSSPTTTDGLGNAQDGSLVITCTAPSMATGRYDVGVDVPKYDKFWVIVNGIEYKYSTTDQDQAIDDAVGQVTGGNATAADILLGKTAYVGGTELTGTMPSYTVQYDSNKTAAENTADAGLTWSSDGSTLTIAEGYHTQQQVNSQTSGNAELLFGPLMAESISYDNINQYSTLLLDLLAVSADINYVTNRVAIKEISGVGSYTKMFESKNTGSGANYYHIVYKLEQCESQITVTTGKDIYGTSTKTLLSTH